MEVPPDAITALLILLGTLCAFVAGTNLLYRGWAQQADAAHRARLEAGERAGQRLRGALEARLQRTRWGSRIAVSLAAAGVDMLLVDFLGLVVASAVAGYYLTGTVFPAWIAILVAFACVRGCWAWVEYRRAKRRELFVAQLPDLARVLSNASSAGLSLRSALEMATSELSEPAHSELSHVSEWLRLGQSTDLALENLQRRMPSREVGVLVATLVIQQRAGGDLVRSLRDMATTLEARKDLRREVKTIMAGSVFTSYIVAVLGVGTLFLLNGMHPGVLDDMASRTGGRIALVIGSLLYALGFYLIRRTTRIET